MNQDILIGVLLAIASLDLLCFLYLSIGKKDDWVAWIPFGALLIVVIKFLKNNFNNG